MPQKKQTGQGVVSLRGHHFLCLLTYKGYGYTPAFVENMTAVAASINAGRPVRLVEGPDDICAALSADDRMTCQHDCTRAESRAMDELAVEAVRAFFGWETEGAFAFTPEIADRLRAAFAEGHIRTACGSCRWREFCDAIAADDFDGTLLFPAT